MHTLFTLLAFLTTAYSFAAAPIFHAVVAQRWIDMFEEYTPNEQRELMLGTLFPDIRYMAKLPRKATHEHGITLQQIKETKDPFLKGMRIHAYVDVVRLNYLKKVTIEEHLKEYEGDNIFYLKMVEDEIIYRQGSKKLFLDIADYFNTIVQQEIDFGIAPEILADWHTSHQQYFANGPQNLFHALEKAHLPFGGVPWIKIKGSNFAMQACVDNPLFLEYIEDILNEFDALFADFAVSAAF